MAKCQLRGSGGVEEAARVRSPCVVMEIRRLTCSRAALLDGCSATESSVNASLVVRGGESIQLATEVEAVPEEGLIEILAPKGSDKPLYKRCERASRPGPAGCGPMAGASAFFRDRFRISS